MNLPVPPPPGSPRYPDAVGASLPGTGVPQRPDRVASGERGPSRARRRRWSITALVTAGVLVVGATGLTSLADAVRGSVAPVPPPVSSSASPAEPVPSSAEYTFLGRSLLGGPVRWDPCETITYGLDLRQAPAYAAADAAEAIERVADATSLELVETAPGVGSLDPTFSRMVERERGITDLGPDMVIVWTSHERYERLRDVHDLKRSIATTFPFVTGGVRSRLIGAIVLVDSRTTRPGGYGGWWSHGPTLLHEMGHAVGLGHVDDAGEIMYDGQQPTLTMSDWGQGDLEGLGRLGRTDECS